MAAQALRWFYLANALADLGLEIDVVCPSMPAAPRCPMPIPMHPRITEHRVWAGPFIGLSQWLALRAGRLGGSVDLVSLDRPSRLFGVYRVVRSVLDHVLYPDVRTEWYPFARAEIKRLLRLERFDVVISSHEPGVDLFLGLWAKRRYGIPWVVDLADPLHAPYSPKWRSWLDLRVEGRILREADRVLLTTDRLRDLLLERHGSLESAKFACVPQGVPEHHPPGVSRVALMPGKMNIVFTGNFYAAFRNPDQFALALRSLANPEIALTIAGDNAAFERNFEGIDNVRFVGRLEHSECLSLQRDADLLLNIGNTQDFQIPGKVYEYIGAARPILHIRGSPLDPSVEPLLSSGMGHIANNHVDLIAGALNPLYEQWKAGALSRDPKRVSDYALRNGWSARARSLLDNLSAVLPGQDRPSCIVLHDFLLVNGGAERLVGHLASELNATLVVGFSTPGLPVGQQGPRPIRLVTLGRAFPGALGRYLVAARRFLRLEPGILGCDAVIYSGVIAPMAVARQYQGCRIYYCHSPPRFLYDLKGYYRTRYGWHGRLGLALLGSWMRPRYERAVRSMDVVLANSENVRRRLKRYLGIDAEVILPLGGLDRYRWIEAGDFFLSTARLEDIKRVDLIVNAFRRMPGKRLIVASGGSRERALRKLAAGAPNISFTSWIADDELARLVGCCRAVIYIPVDEDFGISPVEALAAGKPVIGVAEGGLLETLVDGSTGYLLPPEPSENALISAVERMTDAVALRFRSGCEQRAREIASRPFVDRIIEILRRAEAMSARPVGSVKAERSQYEFEEVE